jgi:hypothetical protein
VVEFKSSPLLYHAHLTLHVQEGVVTISGRVNTFAERTAVERAANRVAGRKILVLDLQAAAIPGRMTGLTVVAREDSTRKEFG